MAARLGLFGVLAIAVLAPWGCAAWRTAPRLPDRNSLVLDQLVITSDAPLPAHHRLLEELQLQRALLSTKLGLPLSDEPIHVFLFSSSDKLAAFMRVQFPDVPQRRAFFVESDTRLSVYAYWGDRVAEDLRHEVAHGYLHAVVPRLPLWLDEGLAEYFEVPRGMDGVNRPHVERLIAEMAQGWRPNLERLERLENAGEMKQTDYAESWAWVSSMLDGDPPRRAMLQAYLQALRQPQPVAPLSQQVRAQCPAAEQQLLDYLGTLHQTLR
jgi:hypothetical protein